MRRAVAREPEKSIALDVVKTRKTEELTQAEQPIMRLGI